jgi:small nuclear ribonucleoprotein (snRNP)-like protein
MAVVGVSTAGVPVKLLHEAEGHPVSIELRNGEIYRGQLDSSEDTMNCHLSNVVHTARDGRIIRCAPRDLHGWPLGVADATAAAPVCAVGSIGPQQCLVL